MTTNPNQPDDTIDDALLDEALAQATPAQLEAKILELTDPTMLSLLDEVLAPQADDQLTQRILASTQQHMRPGTVPVAQPTQPVHTTGVLARIGPSTFRYAAAAAIALAVGLGVWFVNQDPDESIDPPFADNTPAVVDDNASGSDPDWLSDELLASSEGVFGSETSQLEDVLEDATAELDDVTISRDTLWAELDAYEQFLDDIES